jgi:hypothetical protein
MDKDRETLWHNHWTEAKKAKAERREANRAAWQASKKNAINQREATLDAIAPEVAIEPIADAVQANGSLARMRAIMADPDAPLYRRIDAAEVILAYELGPGAAVGIDPDQIAAPAYRFLKAVVEASETPEALQFKALKLIVGIENSRKAAVQSSDQYAANKELLRRMVNGLRHMENVTDGAEHELLPPGADFDLPEGWANRQTPSDPGGQLERLMAMPEAERKARHEALCAKLRTVQAKKRNGDTAG